MAIRRSLHRTVASLSLLGAAVLNPAVPAAAPSPSPPPSSPRGLYQSLAGAIATARGRVLLYLGEGVWRTRWINRDVVWNVAPNTVAETTFDYSGGALQSAEVTFSPGVHVWVKPPGGGVSGTMTWVKYDRNGTVIDARITPDNNASLAIGSTAILFQHLEFAHSPKGLFLGDPFAASGSSVHCESNLSKCGAHEPLVRRVRFLKADAITPGLHVTFKHLSRLQFSPGRSGGDPGNYVVLRDPSFATFDEIDYFPDESFVHGSLDHLNLIADDGVFYLDDAQLFLRTNSSLEFAALDFSGAFSGTSPRNAAVTMTDGIVKAALGRSSVIVLNKNAVSPTRLVADNGSEMSLTSVALNINDLGTSSLRVGNGSRFNLVLLDGTLGLGGSGSIQVGSGTKLDTRLAAVWEQGRPPSVEGEIGLLDINVTGGALYLNDATTLKLSSGKLKSSALHVSSAESPAITGTFSEAALKILGGSTIGVPGGMSLTTGLGDLTDDGTNPLRIVKGQQLPVGRVSISAKFDKFVNAPIASIALYDGSAALSLERQEDGTILGTGLKVDGDLKILSPPPNGQLTLPVALTDGKFKKAPSQAFLLSANWSAVIPANTTYRAQLPLPLRTDGHENLRMFPIAVDFSLVSPLRIPPTPVSFDQTGVHTSASFADVPLRVQILPGSGQYKHGDAPWDGAGDGPEQIRGYQEVVRDTFLGGNCTFHAYVKPQEETLSVSGSFGFNERALVIGLTKVDGGKPLDWKQDGCEAVDLLGAVGGIVGLAFGGLGGSLSGVAVGRIAGGKVDDHIHDMVSAGAAATINSFHGEWRVGF